MEFVEAHAKQEARFNISSVKPCVDSLLNYLGQVTGVQQVAAAGSFRRSKETVGDLDILAIAGKKSLLMDRFVGYEDVAEVLSHGTARSSIVLRCGLQVHLRMVDEDSFGAALQHYTGSETHNVALRKLGRQCGLKINEDGVFKLKERVAGHTEESIYQSLGLAYIPPELRENRGEIEAARDHCLPRLIELNDLKGDLHAHTNWSDGRHTLEEMVAAAQERKFQYLAITDHSDRLKVAGGLRSTRLPEQIERIDRFNEEHTEIKLLKGVEVEILEDGCLELPEDILSRLDLVVGSIHSYFGLPLHKQTQRIMRAMDHKYFSILAHPINRLIGERPPIEVDMIKVIQKAKERGCYIELNCNPRRLDLYDTYCQIAKAEGVLVAIDSDAHGMNGFDHRRYGVGQARRGWLEKDDVINTRPLGELRKLLRQTMG